MITYIMIPKPKKDKTGMTFGHWIVNKCIVVCSNCHREIHAGIRTLEGSDA